MEEISEKWTVTDLLTVVTYLVAGLVTYLVTYLATYLVILTCNTRLTYL